MVGVVAMMDGVVDENEVTVHLVVLQVHRCGPIVELASRWSKGCGVSADMQILHIAGAIRWHFQE